MKGRWIHVLLLACALLLLGGFSALLTTGRIAGEDVNEGVGTLEPVLAPRAATTTTKTPTVSRQSKRPVRTQATTPSQPPARTSTNNSSVVRPSMPTRTDDSGGDRVRPEDSDGDERESDGSGSGSGHEDQDRPDHDD